MVDPGTRPLPLSWKDDLNTFDVGEFGMDVMLSAYSFTGDKKYLARAVRNDDHWNRLFGGYGADLSPIENGSPGYRL